MDVELTATGLFMAQIDQGMLGLVLRPRKNARQAFSLVEVVLAIGVVSFGLLSVLLLIPLGVKQSGDALQKTLAAQTIEAAAVGLWTCTNFSNSTYAPGAPFTNVIFTPAVNATATELRYGIMDSGAWTNQTSPDIRQQVYIRITPPNNPSALNLSGTAYISVAWPASANYVSSTQSWTNQQGFIDTVIYYRLK